MNTEACQYQWDTNIGENGDPCKGVTWENFVPMLYIPLFVSSHGFPSGLLILLVHMQVWLAVFIIFFPLRMLYKNKMVPEDSTEVPLF